MKIVVCIKQIEHIYARTGMDPAKNFIAEEDIVRIINPTDELAVEEAVRIKEALNSGHVILVTVGPLIAEYELRRCYAMGADRLVQIYDNGLEDIDGWSTAHVLSSFIKGVGADIILCGKQALDDRGGCVGILIAERLGLSCVSSVVGLVLNAKTGEIIAKRALERGDREIIRCRLPAVFTVDKGLNEPRCPRLEDLLEASSREIERLGLEDLGIPRDMISPKISIRKLYPPRPRLKKIKAPDSSLSAQERIRMLMSGGGGRQKKKEEKKILELPPHEAAKRTVEFLAENKYL